MDARTCHHACPQITPLNFPETAREGAHPVMAYGRPDFGPLPLFCTRKNLPAPCGLRREAPNICTPRPLRLQDTLVGCGVLWFKPDSWGTGKQWPQYDFKAFRWPQWAMDYLDSL